MNTRLVDSDVDRDDKEEEGDGNMGNALPYISPCVRLRHPFDSYLRDSQNDIEHYEQ